MTSGLNYHHLLYFWTVVREGGISKAAEKLRLSQPAISAQIKTLEAALGERLFQRQGRTLVLTDVGRVVDRYAMEIFAAGSELLETLKRRPSGRTVRLAVGVANAVPKLVVYRLLRPAVEGRGTIADYVHGRRSGTASRSIGDARAWMWSSATRPRLRTCASRCSTICWANRARRSLRERRWHAASAVAFHDR